MGRVLVIAGLLTAVLVALLRSAEDPGPPPLPGLAFWLQAGSLPSARCQAELVSARASWEALRTDEQASEKVLLTRASWLWRRVVALRVVGVVADLESCRTDANSLFNQLSHDASLRARLGRIDRTSLPPNEAESLEAFLEKFETDSGAARGELEQRSRELASALGAWDRERVAELAPVVMRLRQEDARRHGFANAWEQLTRELPLRDAGQLDSMLDQLSAARARGGACRHRPSLERATAALSAFAHQALGLELTPVHPSPLGARALSFAVTSGDALIGTMHFDFGSTIGVASANAGGTTWVWRGDSPAEAETLSRFYRGFARGSGPVGQLTIDGDEVSRLFHEAGHALELLMTRARDGFARRRPGTGELVPSMFEAVSGGPLWARAMVSECDGASSADCDAQLRAVRQCAASTFGAHARLGESVSAMRELLSMTDAPAERVEEDARYLAGASAGELSYAIGAVLGADLGRRLVNAPSDEFRKELRELVFEARAKASTPGDVTRALRGEYDASAAVQLVADPDRYFGVAAMEPR